MIRPRLLPLLSLVVLAGCVAPGMGSLSMNPTIAGGAKVRVDFDGKGQIIPEENSDFQMVSPLLRIDSKLKQALYVFGLKAKNQAPKKIVVEDVSDESPVTWAVDTQPELIDHHWVWSTHLFEPTEKNLQWVYQLDGSVRIFRFTITTADGRTLVMYGTTNYLAMVKSYYRLLLGIDKPPPKTA